MVENLAKRLDLVRDGLLDLYERCDDSLESQLKHWQLLRQEYAILYFARRSGIIRVGCQPVPPAQVSRERARDAIEVHLMLQSLQQSNFCNEPWTLADTSLERYKTEPQGCWKKNPEMVEVRYDGDRENATLHTLWQDIYYRNSDGVWCKTHGQVDGHGLFYLDNGCKRYYVYFADDAKKYSRSGIWEVEYKNEILSPLDSVTSTTAPAHVCRPPEGPARTPARGSAGRLSTPPEPRHTPWSPQVSTSRADVPDTTSPLGGPVPALAAQPTLPTAVSRSWKSATRRHRRCLGPVTAATPGATDTRGGAAAAPYSAEAPPSSPTPAEGPEREPERQPADPGRRLPPAARPNRGRPGRLLRGTGDCSPALAVLRGSGNVLKCYRYRIKKKHRRLFRAVSTTWHWTGEDGADRAGEARLLVWFENPAQRSEFFESVPMPPSVSAYEGLGGL
ncbi:E2 [Leptonychotes weddellii papillomavirus 3]|uniref:Regulatory protein E2 n=1 Tax=Leptonychotes weddellii papillomavirus 3 TaxID=2077304 RepID=A0A2I8B2P7_9PAPI|nr:E2 [Leptonychotes weddellii papillomavirus 3]AUT11914.1 E2 [Leptonychotes weddellii papillomavirus 3]